MKNGLLFVLSILSICSTSFGQVHSDSTWKTIYRESYPRTNNVIHTKLEAKFDYQKAYMNGKVWLTMKPHAYPTDSLVLDAKGMDIHSIKMVKTSASPESKSVSSELKYKYDGWLLRIKLDKTYKPEETYVVMVDYTAKPNELKVSGSAAITEAKGLYFINPTGEDKNKPTQIWTQGETEGTSVWCPIIDKPNQKTTDEIIMTVPDKYVTLSNGKLVSQKKNADGTRTDSWKMELPHSPYLFFMGVGEYAIIKDHYKGKEVSYYVEKEYASTARKIFGLTPEMIKCFEKVTGVNYPWNKYAQIVGRDYVSGAMENTTATLHQESAQQNARQLVDDNGWESVIAHELFHQWFGDYVTTESWSNITVNESFADYGEYLWKEYKYGADAAQETNQSEMRAYFSSPVEAEKNLVRFYYSQREDLFDLVSYQKGGRVLNMLRNVVGDSAFFKGLNLYLNTNKFRNGEAHQLRLALEETSGLDLNWFFNQWYFGHGHPKVTIDYAYDDAAHQVKVTIKQLQGADHLFRLPMVVDVYNGANKTSQKIWVSKAEETFTFTYTTRPDLVNVDALKIMLWEKTDNKTLENFIHQYTYAGNFADRREAIIASYRQLDNPKAIELIRKSLTDPYYGIQMVAMTRLDAKSEALMTAVEPVLVQLSKSAKKTIVQAAAMEFLVKYHKQAYKDMFAAHLNDSSYSVSGAALTGLTDLDSVAGLKEATRQMKLVTKGKLSEAVANTLVQYGTEDTFDYISSNYAGLPPMSREKFARTSSFATYLSNVKDTNNFKKGVDQIVEFRDSIPAAYRVRTDAMINPILQGILDAKAKAGQADKVSYLKSKLP